MYLVISVKFGLKQNCDTNTRYNNLLNTEKSSVVL